MELLLSFCPWKEWEGEGKGMQRDGLWVRGAEVSMCSEEQSMSQREKALDLFFVVFCLFLELLLRPMEVPRLGV